VKISGQQHPSKKKTKNSVIKKTITIVAISIYFIIIATSFISPKGMMLFPYRLKDKWGYCRIYDKKIIIPCTYDEAFPFPQFLAMDGLARIKINNKFGFINLDGTLVIPAIYDDAEDFGMDSTYSVRVKKENQILYIDNTGKQVKAPAKQFGFCGTGREIGSIRIGKIFKAKNGKFGLLQFIQHNTSSDTIIKPIYDSILKPENSEYYTVVLNKKRGYIDSYHKIILPDEYDEIAKLISYYPHIPDKTPVKDRYDYSGFTVKKKKLTGFKDCINRLIIPPKYLDIKYYHDTFCLLMVKTTDNKTGYVNLRNGTEFFEN